MPDRNNSIAKRIRNLRKRLKLTAKEVAYQLDIPTSTYLSWEYGTPIRGEPYRDMAKVFNTSVSFLIFGESDFTEVLDKQIDVIGTELKKLQEMVSVNLIK